MWTGGRALLAHRLGGQQVCSVDIDSQLVSKARHRLARLGYTSTVVTADGADGLAGPVELDGGKHFPFLAQLYLPLGTPRAWECRHQLCTDLASTGRRGRRG
jgi:hypothetical protein